MNEISEFNEFFREKLTPILCKVFHEIAKRNTAEFTSWNKHYSDIKIKQGLNEK